MPLNFNGTAMKAVTFNGTNMKIVNFNGTQVWKAFPDYLFNGGDIKAETGGWGSVTTMNSGATGGLSVGNVLDIYIKGAPSDQRVTAYTKNKIDVTAINKIALTLTNSFNIHCGGDANWWGVRWGIGLLSTIPAAGINYDSFTHKTYATIGAGNPALGAASTLTVSAGTQTLNTSSITGSWYVCVFVHGYDWWGDSGLQVDFKFNPIKCT